jgi:hypothetical protein
MARPADDPQLEMQDSCPTLGADKVSSFCFQHNQQVETLLRNVRVGGQRFVEPVRCQGKARGGRKKTRVAQQFGASAW